MNYVLDTNILLLYLKDPQTKQFIEETYRPLDPDNTAIISAVSIGEIRAIGLKNKWGDKRIAIVQELIDDLVVIGVRFEDLFNAYAEIDAFSQGKISRGVKFSSRNMGKNDLWIAATAHVLDATLMTMDKDFEHLDGEFFDVLYIERKV